MLKTPAFWIMVAFVYLFYGLLWAVSFGINTMELRDSRERTYDHDLFSVVGAEFNGEDLWLCVNGRQMHHREEPAEASQFAIAVPVEDLWRDNERMLSEGFYRPRWDRANVRVPLRQVSQSCEHGQDGFESIPVTELAETEDIGAFFDGYDEAELRQFITDRPVTREVIVIPQSFNATSYSPHRQVVFLNTEPDEYGNRYIDVEVRRQNRERQISSSDVYVAFLSDALTYPYQIHVWTSYAGAH